MAKWEERKIPASDKALRSLYMPASYTENLKGKEKKIRWKKQKKIKPEGEHSVPHDLDTEYTYKKSSGKKSKSGTPTYAGSKFASNVSPNLLFLCYRYIKILSFC